MNHPIIATVGFHLYTRMLKDAGDFRRSKSITTARPKTRFFSNLRDRLSVKVPQDVGKSANSPA